jgi:hypothetical protein
LINWFADQMMKFLAVVYGINTKAVQNSESMIASIYTLLQLWHNLHNILTMSKLQQNQQLEPSTSSPLRLCFQA